MDDSSSVHLDALIRAPSGVYRSLVLSGADREVSFALVDAGTGAWTEAQKDTMRAVFDAWEAVADLRFTEVAAGAAPEWREQMFGPDDIKTASHSLPWAFEMQGSYKFGPEVPAGPGSQMMALFLHETAHGLGLGHSRDGFPGVTKDNSGGDHGLRDAMFTQMAGVGAGDALTITGGAFGGETDGGRVYGNPATPMAFDIAAVQFLYGANMLTNAGDDAHVLPTSNEPGLFWSSIWDAGGHDVLRHDGTAPALLDLRPATLDNEIGGGGYVSRVEGVDGGFTIAAHVLIEDARGGEGGDSIHGNDGDNRIEGRRGNDRITGGAGADVFVFTRGDGADMITDFLPGVDRLEIDGRVISPDTLPAGFAIYQSGADVHVQYGEGDVIILVDVSLSDWG